MKIAKALVLAGHGAHDRPWPSVGSYPKHLVPVANRPILVHKLMALRQANIVEVAIAVESDSVDPTMNAVGDGSLWGVSIQYVPWDPPSGLAGALSAGSRFLKDEPVLIEPADALHCEQIYPHIAAFANRRLDAMALRLSNSPRGADGQPVISGYMLSRRAIAVVIDSIDGDAEPFASVRDDGGRVTVRDLDGCLACHGDEKRLLEANRRALEALPAWTDEAAFPSSEFQGPVVVDPTASVENTLIRGPAIIGPGSHLRHAYVGPYTSIGAGVVLDGCEIEHSIVLDGAQIRHIGTRLESSIIGRGARVARSFGMPSAMRLSVGDRAEVTLG